VREGSRPGATLYPIRRSRGVVQSGVSRRRTSPVVDKDPPEKAHKKRRHLVDCLAYILLDEPYFAEPRREQKNTLIPRYKGIAY